MNGAVAIVPDTSIPNSLSITQGSNTYTASNTAVVAIAGTGNAVTSTAAATIKLQDNANPTSLTMASGGTLQLGGSAPASITMSGGGTIETLLNTTNTVTSMSAGAPVTLKLAAPLTCTTMDATTGITTGSYALSSGTLTATAAKNLTVNAGEAVLNGALTGANALTAGKLTLNSTASVAGTLAVSDSGQLASQIPLAGTTIKGGTVTAPSASALAISGGTTTLTGALSGTSTVSGGTLNAGSISGPLTISGIGAVTSAGDVTGVTANGGSLTVNGGSLSNSSISSGTVSAPAASGLTLSGGTTSLAGALSGANNITNGKLSLASTASILGTLAVSGSAEVNSNAPLTGVTVQGGTVSAPSASALTVSGGAVTLSGELTGSNSVIGGSLSVPTLPAGASVSVGPGSLSLSASPAGTVALNNAGILNLPESTPPSNNIALNGGSLLMGSSTSPAFRTTIQGLPSGAVVTIAGKDYPNGDYYIPQQAEATYTSSDKQYTAHAAITQNGAVLNFSKAADPACTCTITAPTTYQFAPPLLLPGMANVTVDLAATRQGNATGQPSGCALHPTVGAVAYEYRLASGSAAISGNTLTVQPGATELALDVVATYNGKSDTKRVTIPVGAVTLSGGAQAVKRGGSVTLTLQNMGAISALTANGNKVNYTPSATSVTIDKSFTNTLQPINVALTTANFGARTFPVKVEKYFASIPTDLTRSVSFGTSRSQAAERLPSTARVKLDQRMSSVGDTVTLDISNWTSTDYNAREAGDYTFTGTLTIPRKYRDNIAFDRNAPDAYTTTVEAIVTVKDRNSDNNSSSTQDQDDEALEERRRSYWDGIKEEIKDADPGDTIYADDRFDLMYADVLEELRNTRATLVIERSRGKDITIDSKEVKKVPSNVVMYDMEELYDMYGKTSSTSASSDTSSSRTSSSTTSSMVSSAASSSSATSKAASSVPQITTPPVVTSPITPATPSSATSSSKAESSSRVSSSEAESSESSESSESVGLAVAKPVVPEPEKKTGVDPMVIVLIATAVAALAAGIVCVVLIRKKY